jgi:hypothetical protein
MNLIINLTLQFLWSLSGPSVKGREYEREENDAATVVMRATEVMVGKPLWTLAI